jgi:hypothetical protein
MALRHGTHFVPEGEAGERFEVPYRAVQGGREFLDVLPLHAVARQEVQRGLRPAATRKPRPGGRSRTKRPKVGGARMFSRR